MEPSLPRLVQSLCWWGGPFSAEQARMRLFASDKVLTAAKACRQPS